MNARDDQGNTPLLDGARFFARGWKRRDGWTLLEKGADVNASNNLGGNGADSGGDAILSRVPRYFSWPRART